MSPPHLHRRAHDEYLNQLFSLKGFTAVVTGASSGIGQRIAFALSQAGANLILVARDQEKLKNTQKLLATSGGESETIPFDLSSNCEDLSHQITSRFGSPDILVNNAGINLRQHVNDIDQHSWDATLDLNLKTPFFLARSLINGMQSRAWGRIINIASLQSFRAFPNSIPYGASKGGVTQLTRAMAEAWSHHGINCNAIAPGYFPTELTASVYADKARIEYLANQTTVGRNGELKDLDGLIVFLCSPASNYVTGQTIALDGGFTAK